jgi:hypothetical protein
MAPTAKVLYRNLVNGAGFKSYLGRLVLCGAIALSTLVPQTYQVKGDHLSRLRQRRRSDCLSNVISMQ